MIQFKKEMMTFVASFGSIFNMLGNMLNGWEEAMPRVSIVTKDGGDCILLTILVTLNEDGECFTEDYIIAHFVPEALKEFTETTEYKEIHGKTDTEDEKFIYEDPWVRVDNPMRLVEGVQ